MFPPANVWIVEVLGHVTLQFTTLVAHVRDEDLKVMPGSLF